MKNLFAVSLISVSLLLANKVKSVNAQVSCQEAVNTTLRDIRNRSVRVNYNLGYNDSHINNRTRINSIKFRLNYLENNRSTSRSSYDIAVNILHSGVLMKSYANDIFRRCNGTGSIIFGLDGTDWVEVFIMTDNGILGYEACGAELNRPHQKITRTYTMLGQTCAYIVPNF